MDVERDRISYLPKDLLCEILSSGSTKDVVIISSMSSGLLHVWSSMPNLNLSTNDVGPLHDFSNVVGNILSCRDDGVDLSYVKLDFWQEVNPAPVQQIINYASEHKAQKLDFTWALKANPEVSHSVFSCQSLKHLSVTGSECLHDRITTPLTWDLPDLKTAYLENVNLCVDNANPSVNMLSSCVNLEALTLKRCRLWGSNRLNINHPQVSNIRLEDFYSDVVVVAPQLKDLTRINGSKVFLGSVPNLVSLLYRDAHDFQLSIEGVHSLELVDICIPEPNRYNETTQNFATLLQQLYTVKHLTLNLELVKVLSLRVDLISGQPSPFANLESLKIYPVYNTSEEPTQQVTEVINYLLGASENVDFDIISGTEEA